ncbi:MAG: hypothetical protein R3323_04900, partial [Wenzhouxiangellaceae bacterium]|nr:hypothetical protein [Wenzhouxiangellaceae bacterium]
GPWPNRVFVYRDDDGVPALDDPQRSGTVITGDGTGAYEIDFDAPWRIEEPVFWILVQGDPSTAGEDFNVETDQSSEPAGRSYLTDLGLEFMFQTEQNWMIRANIRAAGPSGRAVPVLSGAGLAALVVVLLAAGMLAAGRRRAVDGPGAE